MEIYTAAARYNLYRAAGHRIPEHSLAELIRLFTGYHEVISDQHWSMCQHYQPHYPPWHHQTHHVALYLSTYTIMGASISTQGLTITELCLIYFWEEMVGGCLFRE